MPASYRFPGDYNIQKLLLTDYSQSNQIAIGDLVKQIDLYESIFDNTLKAELTIVDGIGLIETVPIVGEETVEIKIATPGSPEGSTTDRISHTFSVGKVQNREKGPNNTDIYNITLDSSLLLTGATQQISKHYQGLISDIAGKIYRQAFPSDKGLNTEPTINNVNLVIPSLNLFEALNMLTYWATTDKNGNLFFVYEDHLNGLNFKSVGAMLSSDPIQTYTYSVNNVDHTNPFIASNVKIGKDFDITVPAAKGAFASEVTSVDLLTKTFSTKKFAYKDSFGSTPHISNNKLILDANQLNTNAGKTFTYLSDARRKDSKYIKESKSELDLNYKQTIEDHVALRNSIQQQIDQNKMIIEVPGDLRLVPGKTINVIFPANDSTTKSNTRQDGYLSGKYLITHARHSLVMGSNYKTALQLIRDTRASKIKGLA